MKPKRSHEHDGIAPCRAEQAAREQEDLERKVLEDMASPSREMTSESWKALRSELKRKTDGKRAG